MQNSFSKCREWVPRGTSQHKWRWLTTLLLILTFAIGQMWAADNEFTFPTSGTNTIQYVYALTGSNSSLDGNKLYYSTSQPAPVSANYGIEATKLGLVFKPSENCKLSVKMGNNNTSAATITATVYKIYKPSADSYLYPLYTGNVGKDAAAAVLSAVGESSSSSDVTGNWWKNIKILKYGSNKWQVDGSYAKKTLSGETVSYASVYNSLFTATTLNAASTKSDKSKASVQTIQNGGVDYVFQKDTMYLIYCNRSTSNVGFFSVSFEAASTPTCTSPEIAWSTQPAGGNVGDADFVASVTTTPAEQAVTWTSSVPAAATVSNGTIHYVAPGFTKISAEFTYSGSDYCEEKVSVNKDIVVPISTDATGANDKYWYYTTAVPGGSPDNGLNYSGTKSGAGMYGTKLNSDGYAWFVKPAVAGTLRVGAFKSDGSGSNYAVEVYACDDEGTISGDALGTLTTPHAGGVSATMDIAADVEGIRIKRSTNSEGILYFVEFKAAPSTAYSVTYKANGGVGADETDNDATTIADCPFTYSGKAFTGWNTKAEGDGTPYAVGAAVPSDLTLYAQWADKYTVTLMPAGGTCASYEDWTYDDVNDKYTIEVGSGAEVTLPTFTKDNRTFKTWRNGVPADVESPITVTADVTLTAVWNATVENVLYSWEGGSPATEVGGTAVTKAQDGTDAETSDINVDAVGTNATYKAIKVQGKISSNAWSGNYIQITTDEAVKTGDKVKITACTTKGDTSKKGSAQIRVGTSATGTAIVSDGGTYNDIAVATDVPVPNTKTFTITAEGINTSTLSMTRQSTNTNCWVTKLQIVREVLVEEANIRTVTFNYNDGGATASKVVEVASGSKVSAEAAPSYAHHRFHEWQLGGVAYNFATAVTSDITLVADWTQLYSVTYAKGEESATGDAPTQDELAAGETFTVAANPFAFEGHDFSTWHDGSKDVAPASEYTMGAANVTLTAQWITATTKVTVTYKDGETTLGSEEITINTGHPAEYATYQTRNLATFDGWYNDPDLAEGHKIADISELTASADVNVYGKWNYQYASSANIEQWTLDNGKGVSDAQKETQTGALMSLLGTRKYASNIAYDKGNIELDSLNDDPGKTNRNNAYLGLKVKKSGKMLDFRLAKDSYVKVKFGNVAATPQVSINGADYADMEITDGVYSYTATGNDYISIKTASDGAVVFKQIMINEEIQNVILPAIVTLDANGGTYADASVKYTGTALVIGDATPADEYHVFAGWFDGDDQINATAYVPTKNVTLQAHYAPKPYSITYMPNGGSGAEFITDDNATEVAEGTLFTAPASSAFVEWNTQADGNGDSYLPGAAVTADLTLFAQWETSYTVTFDLQGHGDAIDLQNIVSGGKVVKPADPSADAWEFGGWYKESTCENEWDFATDVVTTTTTIFAKWTADPCPTPFSLSKVVLTSASDGTVTGYNNDEYAGEKVIGGLNSTETAEVDLSHEGTETGYKLNSGGSAIVFATLKKGTFQVGDRVVVTITKKQDAYKVEEVAQPIMDIYYGTDKNDATFLTTIENVTAAGSYTYRLTAADVTAIGSKKGIGVFRPSSGRTQNPYVYSVEIKGCREWAIFHTLTFKNIDGTATIAAESLEEGAYASTVAPAAPKITLKRFLGWAEAIDGTPVDLTTYTITEDKTLYAVYEDIDCSATGVKFSMTPKANELTENYEPKGDEERDYAEYATLVGGKVFINNVDASNKRISVLKETSHIKLEGGDDGYIHVELDCPLNEKDTIKIENDQKWKVSVAKGSGYVAKAKADKYHVVPAAWDGKYDFYIKRDGSSLTISGIQVVRPAKFDVSFNMMGHGTQIADIEDVLEGSKISAPTAPTDADYSFAGWYKENTLENEWKFDVDVVETNTTLYAKWLDKSDATLKTLRYGDTEIALEAGEFTYNVNLSPLATTVPALTAVTSSPNATAQVNNAAALDGEGHATSIVVVTPEVGAAKTYTVNFTKVHLYTELVDVTGHTEWSWVGMSTQEIDKANEIGTILANYVIGNHFEKIEGKADEYASRNTDGGVYQGTYLKFHTTVPGAVTVTYRGTGNSSNVTLTIGTEQLETYAGGFTDSKKVIVPAGDVKITSEGTMRVQKIVFQTLDEVTPDYSRPVTIDRMGTVCVDHNVPAGCFIGAEVYRLLYWKYGTSYADCLMVDFEEVDEMEAGNPYLIIPTEETFKLYYGGVKDETPNEVNHFIGTYNPIAQGTEGDAILMGKYGVVNNQIRLLGSGAYSPANRAYIDLENLQSKEEYEAANPSNPAPKKRISLSREGAAVATGLDAINVDTETVQKVMIDGQMYIIRGGHIFTVSGNLVK